MAKKLNDKNILCEQCGNKYKRIGQHWSMGKGCEHSNISQYKKDILTGILMGDGTIGNKDKTNQYIKAAMISPNYLEYVDNKLGWLSTGVKFHISSEEIAKKDSKRGFNTNAKAENYSDQYVLTTRSHPFITSLTDWYSTGEKVWPDDIELTPTVLKHWYIGDGYYDNNGSNNYISIAMANEIENMDKVFNYFSSVGLPEPYDYFISSRKNGSNRCHVEWTVEGSQKLFQYMGEPLPDFEYKWPEN
jgi:hypothetical protein